MAINSRNETERYSYFFVSKSVKRYLSSMPIIEFFVYKYENSVTAERGKKELRDEFTLDVYEMSEDFYNREYFTHPKYRNQKNEFLRFKYTDLPVNLIAADNSRK